MIISICTDIAQLKEHPAIKTVDGEISAARGKILATGGTNIHYKDNMSIVGLTGLDGLEALADLDYVTITSYEEIFGYFRQAISGLGELQGQNTSEQTEPLMILVPAVDEMRALYDLVYPRTPITTEDGTYTPPILMGIAGGYDISHLNI